MIECVMMLAIIQGGSFYQANVLKIQYGNRWQFTKKQEKLSTSAKHVNLRICK
jgi:hypothetical protein